MQTGKMMKIFLPQGMNDFLMKQMKIIRNEWKITRVT